MWVDEWVSECVVGWMDQWIGAWLVGRVSE